MPSLLPAAAENLLVNPGFDSMDTDGAPEDWDLFVMPMEGALGEVDSSSMGSPFSVKLHNPEVYPREPANNWSQTIIGELSGERLRVSGSIRTVEATEAALWLQCWSRNPPRVLAAHSTSTDSPVYGTKDWEPVSMIVEVPEGTDFVVLRCVLKGRGTAWFDDVAVEKDFAMPATMTSNDSGDRGNGMDGGAMKELLAVNASLSEALSAMSDTNTQLLNQITALQDELKSLRTDLAENAARSASVVPRPEGTLPPPMTRGDDGDVTRYGPHPLVPADWVEVEASP